MIGLRVQVQGVECRVQGGRVCLYVRLIDACIPQLQVQGPSRTCDESKKEEEEVCLFRMLSLDVAVLGRGRVKGSGSGFRMGGSACSSFCFFITLEPRVELPAPHTLA